MAAYAMAAYGRSNSGARKNGGGFGRSPWVHRDFAANPCKMSAVAVEDASRTL
jgi:hypothetical protein